MRLFFVVLLSLSPLSWADTISGRVVGISDGDTIVVLDTKNKQHKIRLSGIDAPEKRQAFGTKSKEALSADIFDKEIEVEFTKCDKYGRIIGKVILDYNDMNIRQIERGLAWHYKEYMAEQDAEDREMYEMAEFVARSMGTGLWADSHPVPPWDFRRKQTAEDARH